jgi:FkbM family methyltransferase
MTDILRQLQDFLVLKSNSLMVRLQVVIKYFSVVDSKKSLLRFTLNKATPQLHFLAAVKSDNYASLYKYSTKSTSQIFQDLFAINELNYLRDGFFVEFGAFDGITDSNSLLLEKEFNWRGILAEPSKRIFLKLSQNRKNNMLDDRAVFSNTGLKILFNETVLPSLSTIDSFSGSDGWDRSKGVKYVVDTISLQDLLIEKNAPKRINYLSLDTEGSEFEILKFFDFESFEIDIITVEHNFGESREKVWHLLIANGYSRKYENISSFDDWYVHKRVTGD